jgi:hypothetical protein
MAKVKVKVKLFLPFFVTEHYAMKAYWRNGGIAPRPGRFTPREGALLLSLLFMN